MKLPLHTTSKSGFTLVELLVAMAISSVIVIALLGIVNQTSATYSNTQRAVNSIAETRAFMHFFDKEFSTRLPSTPLIHSSGNGNTPSTSDTIAFIRTLSSTEQNPDAAGDLGTSAYYVAFPPSKGSTIVPRLYRKILNTSDTQALLDNPGNTASLSPDTTHDEPIFDNILSFKAQRKVRNPTTGELEDHEPTSTLPIVAVELTIRFIDESFAHRFTTIDDWNRIAISPKDNELNFIRIFSRTISVTK